MIEFLVDRKRTALAILVVLIIAGIFGRINIPIEDDPEITIPVVYVGAGLTGISPQDSERLLLKPMEDEIRGIEGIDELQGVYPQDMDMSSPDALDEACGSFLRRRIALGFTGYRAAERYLSANHAALLEFFNAVPDGGFG